MSRDLTDRELYDRGIATAVACWAGIARRTPDAALVRAPGVMAAVFPTGPERAVYNNAVLERDLPAAARDAGISAMEDAYAAAGVDRFAAWTHETDHTMIDELTRRGYRCDETTRAMAMTLDELDRSEDLRIDLDVDEPTWPEYQAFLTLTGAPPGLLDSADASAFHITVVRVAGTAVSTSLAFDHDGDCGIFNVSTLPEARRRGLAGALTRRHLEAARQRGCSTASLQSSPMAERVYAAHGFKDLGRILEYVR